MNKIFIWCIPNPFGVVGYALAEDGTGIGSHISSNESFSKWDMGVTDPDGYKHKAYKAHYPNGYELEWVERANLDAHQGFQEAWAKHTPDKAIKNEVPE